MIASQYCPPIVTSPPAWRASTGARFPRRLWKINPAPFQVFIAVSRVQGVSYSSPARMQGLVLRAAHPERLDVAHQIAQRHAKGLLRTCGIAAKMRKVFCLQRDPFF